MKIPQIVVLSPTRRFITTVDRVYDENSVKKAFSIYGNAISSKKIETKGLYERLKFRGEINNSFGISKAENSKLKKDEAIEIFEKLKIGNISTIKKHDELEFLGILMANGYINSLSPDTNIDMDLIKSIHYMTCSKLDRFKSKIPGFLEYNAGELRTTDDVVGMADYIPVESEYVLSALNQVIEYMNEDNLTLADIFRIHHVFYGIHPFRNGNKRTVRTLEHFLLKKHGYIDATVSVNYQYYKYKDSFTDVFGKALAYMNSNVVVPTMITFYFNALLHSLMSGIKDIRSQYIFENASLGKFERRIIEKTAGMGSFSLDQLKIIFGEKRMGDLERGLMQLVEKNIIVIYKNPFSSKKIYVHSVSPENELVVAMKEIIEIMSKDKIQVRKIFRIACGEDDAILTAGNDLFFD